MLFQVNLNKNQWIQALVSFIVVILCIVLSAYFLAFILALATLAVTWNWSVKNNELDQD